MNRLRPRLTYANVVATLALVLAIGGASAFAASQLPKGSVGTRQLKKNAVTGAKVKNGSLTGADISGNVNSALTAATAGRAVVAEKADHAATAEVADGATRAGFADLAKLAEGALHASGADALEGKHAADFQPAGSVQRLDFTASGCFVGTPGCRATVLESSGLVLEAFCTRGADTEVGLDVSGTTGGTYWRSGLVNTTPVSEEFSFGSTPFVLLGISATAARYQGNLILRSGGRTVALELAATQDNNGACQVVAVPTTA